MKEETKETIIAGALVVFIYAFFAAIPALGGYWIICKLFSLQYMWSTACYIWAAVILLKVIF